MPELPDITLYVDALTSRVVGQGLERVRLASPFLLRSAEPPLTDLAGRTVVGVGRLGKRIVLAFEGEFFAVLHLMIAGRLHWKPAGVDLPRRRGLAAFDFPHGSLLLSEAGTKHRASLHVVRGGAGLGAHGPGGLDVLGASPAQFRAELTRESHTLKRTLTDPRLFDGIGNAYSDEILHAARLSPLRLTSQLSDAEVERLFRATRETLSGWIERLRAAVRGSVDLGAGHVRSRAAARVGLRARALRAPRFGRAERYRRAGAREQRRVPPLGAGGGGGALGGDRHAAGARRDRLGGAPSRDLLPPSRAARGSGDRVHVGGSGPGRALRAPYRDPARQRSPGVGPGALAVVPRPRQHRSAAAGRPRLERPLPPSSAPPRQAGGPRVKGGGRGG